MKFELTNLLPEENIQAYRRRYYMRALTVLLYVLVVLSIIHVGLLIPTYLYFVEDVRQKESSLAYVQERLALVQAEGAGNIEEQVQRDALRVVGSSTPTKILPAFQKILSVHQAGVTLNSFSIDVQEQSAYTIKIQGVASTRDTLQKFRQSMQSQPFITSVVLPVSAFAKDKDIAFDMTLVTRTIDPLSI